MVQLLWKRVWWFLKKLSIALPYDSAVPPLNIYSREMETYVHKGTCTQMFIFIEHYNSQKVETTQMSINDR